jgi:hypothetical protein
MKVGICNLSRKMAMVPPDPSRPPTRWMPRILVFGSLELAATQPNTRAGREAQRRDKAGIAGDPLAPGAGILAVILTILLYHAPPIGRNTQATPLKTPVARKQVNNNTPEGTCNGVIASPRIPPWDGRVLCGDNTVVKNARQTTESHSGIRRLPRRDGRHNPVVVAAAKQELWPAHHPAESKSLFALSL